MITVRRPSGIVVPFDAPELSIEASIGRSCEVPAGSLLLQPKTAELLQTYPLPYPRVTGDWITPYRAYWP